MVWDLLIENPRQIIENNQMVLDLGKIIENFYQLKLIVFLSGWDACII